MREDGSVIEDGHEMANMTRAFYEQLYHTKGVLNLDDVINMISAKVRV
jgi:hypothetical protein